nr:MFS transporter [Bombiscardovia coagulans]
MGQLLSPTVEFASIPFLSFILTKNGMTTHQAGTVVTVRSLLNLVGILVGGRLLPKLNAKHMVITCAFINAGTYFIATIPIPLVVALSLSVNGLTLGLYYSFESELILNSCSKTEQAHVYSIIRTLINIGGAVGPLVASVFSNFYGTIFFALLGVVSLIYPLTLLTTYKVQNEVRDIQDIKDRESTKNVATGNGVEKSFKAFFALLIALTIGTVSISAYSSVVPMLVNERGGTPFSYTVGVWINTLGVVFVKSRCNHY